MGRVVAALLLSAVALSFAPAVGTASAQAFMPLGGRTSQPVGHYELCQRAPAECKQVSQKRRPVELTRDLWKVLIDVNNAVNTMYAPRTDLEMWGREEYWSYPVNGFADCEDYALEKRRMLAQAGVPVGNLLMTVVRQTNGEGHAVLTVRTSLGDFILDNLEPKVLAWQDTDYQYLKRQSELNSGAWISIEDDRQMLVGSVK